MDHSTTIQRSDLKDEHTITEPVIIPRPEHEISRADISPGALKVLYALKDEGYEAYLVGGGVRDLLLGHKPKDFDVATDARPEEIRKIFRRCHLIGRRFRLAHVRVGREVVEVATFRGLPEERDELNGRIVRDNVYGTLEEDAWRRDFSVNCLYYNIKDFSVVDYTGGLSDLQAKTLRLIGDPEVRYREDPVRMLRALRFAAKLDFRLDSATATAISTCADLLSEVPPARLYEEVLKLFHGGAAVRSFEMLRRYDLFRYLFPETDSCFAEDEYTPETRLVVQALENTDKRIGETKPVTPSFLFAALLWPPMWRDAQAYCAQGFSELQAMELAGDDTIARQGAQVSLPRRFSVATREIWSMQPRLIRNRGKRATGLLTHPRFRAAYDFLLLRAQSGEDLKQKADWWTRIQTQENDGAQRDVVADTPRRPRRRRRRRGGQRLAAG